MTRWKAAAFITLAAFGFLAAAVWAAHPSR